jgi:hypothetical protein
VGWDWVHLVRRRLIGLLYQPQMIDDECGPVCGMRIGRGNRSTRRKPAPMPLCPPQIPHDLTLARTQAAAVESRRLTAWAIARQFQTLDVHSYGQAFNEFESSIHFWSLFRVFVAIIHGGLISSNLLYFKNVGFWCNWGSQCLILKKQRLRGGFV